MEKYLNNLKTTQMAKKSAYLLLLTLALYISACKEEPSKTVGQTLELTNTAAMDLKEKAIGIKREKLMLMDSLPHPLLTTTEGDTIPAQLDDLNGDGNWDELFFVVDLSKNVSKTLSLKWLDKPLQFPKRTSARFGKRSSDTTAVQPATEETLTARELPKSLGYQQYQTDGPSWENDKVGFRHYLDGRNAKDLFGKKTSQMSPETVGINKDGAVEDNYHVMEAWGRDILAVGNSIGLGGFGLVKGEDLMRLGVTVNDSVNNVGNTHFRILAEGPVRSILNYEYRDWETKSGTYGAVENTSIWPGMYAYKNSVLFSGLQGDEEMVVGLVNINAQNQLQELQGNDRFVVLYTHDQQTYDRQWWLGMALILPRDRYLGYMEAPREGPLSQTYLARLKASSNEAVEYYAVGCWELSDEKFRDPTYFTQYLQELADTLAAEVKVDIK